MFDIISQIIAQIKHAKPLILNITNDVTMDFIANGLLCLGASPIMSKAPQESADLLKIASRVVINPGTLNDDFLAHSEQVCALANTLNIPIVLDPVGAGASFYRTSACKRLLSNFNIAILRGNASEIMALAGHSQKTRGVDSDCETQYAIESAQTLAQAHNVTVVISGPTDAVVDTHQVKLFNRGSPLMPFVTGTGCLFSAVVSAFDAVHSNRFTAACAATLFYSVCGELAASNAQKPGAFKIAFLDALYSLPNGNDYNEK
jgi:hydroxyethylthiazole kinase